LTSVLAATESLTWTNLLGLVLMFLFFLGVSCWFLHLWCSGWTMGTGKPRPPSLAITVGTGFAMTAAIGLWAVYNTLRLL